MRLVLSEINRPERLIVFIAFYNVASYQAKDGKTEYQKDEVFFFFILQ